MRYFRKVDDTAAYYAAINTKNKRYKQAWLDHDKKRYWIINTAINAVKELWLEEYRGRYDTRQVLGQAYRFIPPLKPRVRKKRSSPRLELIYPH